MRPEVKAMYELDKQKFGAFVTALRKEQGMTQKELASRLYLSDKAVSKWETGVSVPDTAILIPLSEALGVTVTELLLGERGEKPLPPEQVEALVKTAIQYPGGKSRAFQEKSPWPVRYLVAAVVCGLGLWGNHRLAVPSTTVSTLAVLALIFGAYFCFFVKRTLPYYHDLDRIGAVSDGPFRMNLPGVAINNRNWPKLILVGRWWSCAVAALWPLAALALGSLFPQLWQWAELPLALLITLGGLFVPMCLVGKRYE